MLFELSPPTANSDRTGSFECSFGVFVQIAVEYVSVDCLESTKLRDVCVVCVLPHMIHRTDMECSLAFVHKIVLMLNGKNLKGGIQASQISLRL